MLRVFVRGVKVNELSVFIGLRRAAFFFEFFVSEEITIDIWVEVKTLCFFKEFLFSQHAVFNDDFNVFPFSTEILTIIVEQAFEFIGHFTGYVTRDFFDGSIGL